MRAERTVNSGAWDEMTMHGRGLIFDADALEVVASMAQVLEPRAT
jgi:hypothetical protein